jgi:hypothetical protein
LIMSIPSQAGLPYACGGDVAPLLRPGLRLLGLEGRGIGVGERRPRRAARSAHR